MITRLNRLAAVPPLLVLCLIASSVRAQDPSADFIVGKSTKAEVPARFGAPAYETERYWSYSEPNGL